MDIRSKHHVGTRYVLFYHDPVTLREIYAARHEADNSIGTTPCLSYAIPFETARTAYEFGRENNLPDMKVGYR